MANCRCYRSTVAHRPASPASPALHTLPLQPPGLSARPVRRPCGLDARLWARTLQCTKPIAGAGASRASLTPCAVACDRSPHKHRAWRHWSASMCNACLWPAAVFLARFPLPSAPPSAGMRPYVTYAGVVNVGCTTDDGSQHKRLPRMSRWSTPFGDQLCCIARLPIHPLQRSLAAAHHGPRHSSHIRSAPRCCRIPANWTRHPPPPIPPRFRHSGMSTQPSQPAPLSAQNRPAAQTLPIAPTPLPCLAPTNRTATRNA